MVFAATITVRAVMQSVVDEVLEKDQRSDENDNSAKCLRVVCCFGGKQGSRDGVQGVKERERGSAYPGVASGCGNERDSDQNAAVPRENERVE